MYDKKAEMDMYNKKKATPIVVMRKGKLNMPVPNAPAINANIAAKKGVFIETI
jgi:hypothetical protein